MWFLKLSFLPKNQTKVHQKQNFMILLLVSWAASEIYINTQRRELKVIKSHTSGNLLEGRKKNKNHLSLFVSLPLGPPANVTFLNPILVSRSSAWFCYTFQSLAFSGRKVLCPLITIEHLQFSTKPSAVFKWKRQTSHPELRLTFNWDLMSSW